MAHKHHEVRSETWGYSYCLDPSGCEPAAHGGVGYTDYCSCGATRSYLVNAGRTEPRRLRWQEGSKMDRKFTIRDPFAGFMTIIGPDIETAIEWAYEDISPEERPAYVWYKGRQIAVPGGLAHPIQ